MSSSTADDLSWVSPLFSKLFDESHASGKAATGHSPAVAAVKVLTEVIQKSKASTMMGLQITLGEAADLMKAKTTNIAVASACELFARFVTRTSLDTPDFYDCKQKLLERGNKFAENSEEARKNIALLVDGFLKDGATVLTHSMSRVVLHALIDATRKGKAVEILIPESRHDGSGYVLARHLRDAGVPFTMIMDAAVAHLMDRVDIVLIGAEAVAENGGIINKMGTYQIALVANALNKPFYVLAETFKFTRIFPLTQTDFPQQALTVKPVPGFEDLQAPEASLADYTPPNLISLLFTEIGVLTPAAVSDNLIAMYL
eukprot:TRINITY_DN7651_c0_g1_i1.p1 TRINITY_DN7651_c0_g1~~TRINITY_DN7651_c0_g1_i1.p1  ORF type:complete len:328 (+),score=154.21 TRINITY_DN7651_c0_g1_i1:39-986(+)